MKKSAVRVSVLMFSAVLLYLLTSFPVHGQVPESLKEEIIQSFYTGEDLDVSEYQLTREELQETYIDLILSGKLPWYADQKFKCTLTENNGTVSTFSPQFLNKSQYDRNSYERIASEILAETVFEGMEPWEKALSVHDYLIVHSQYDESQSMRQGYDLLVNGTGVCSSYAYAYMDLMNRIGIPCVVVESKTMGMGTGHSWNLINLDGKWYHVDLTWDDPTPNVEGRVMHKYFLLTDEEMLSEAEEGHFGWETDLVCDGTAYQNGIWKGVRSQMVFLDAQTCIYRSQEDWVLYINSHSENGTRILHTEKPDYFDIGKGPKAYEHNGLALFHHRIYYSSVNVVYSMNPDGTDIRREYAHDIPGTGQFILGCTVDRDQIRLTLSDCDFRITSQQVPLEPTGYHMHSYSSRVVPSTCLEGGYTEFTCSCGVSYIGDRTDPTGHQYECHVLEKPSFSKEGLQEYVCTLCGDTYRESVPPLTPTTFLETHPYVIVIALGLPVVTFFTVFFAVKKKNKKK